jgi:hypothetical protein
MVQNCWVSGLCPSSGILNTIFWKLNVSILRWGEGDSWDPSPHLRTETEPVSEMLCFLVFRILDDGQSPGSR